MSRSRRALLLTAALLSTSAGAAARAAPREIVTWAANTLDWNERLGVTMMRQGCDVPPDACLHRIGAAAKAQRIPRWVLSMPRDASRVASDALRYSQLSLVEPTLVQVDIDDFVDALKSWHRNTLGNENQVAVDVARNIKIHNPRLGFGVTIYEDDLDSTELKLLPTDTRILVDRVSLYLHYRENAPRYAEYVAKARRLFPKADIWAGSYAYDRIDYLPCAQTGSRHCTGAQELQLYRESLDIQVALLRDGTVAGIEFYPGYFGLEDKWNGWVKPRICAPNRLRECVERTRKMRQFAAAALQSLAAVTASPSAGHQ